MLLCTVSPRKGLTKPEVWTFAVLTDTASCPSGEALTTYIPPSQSSEREGTFISRQLCGMTGKRRKDILFLWPVPTLFESDTAVPHLGQAHLWQGAPHRLCLCGLAYCFSPALSLFPRLSLTSRAPPYPDSWPACLSKSAVSSNAPCRHDTAFPSGPRGPSLHLLASHSPPSLLSLVTATLPNPGGTAQPSCCVSS